MMNYRKRRKTRKQDSIRPVGAKRPDVNEESTKKMADVGGVRRTDYGQQRNTEKIPRDGDGHEEGTISPEDIRAYNDEQKKRWVIADSCGLDQSPEPFGHHVQATQVEVD